MVIPFAMGTHQGGPLGRTLFVLVHFIILHSITNCFPFYLFPFIGDDIHIIGPLAIVSFVYEHFQTELRGIGLSMQPYKCVAWSPCSLSPNFDTPSKGIKVLGVPLGITSFTSSFIKNVLLKNV
jgi:hypothetical protein